MVDIGGIKLKKNILFLIMFFNFNLFAFCADTKFQQYTQDNIEYPVYNYNYPNMMFGGLKRFHRFYFLSSYHLYNQENYINNHKDKNTFVSPDEYIIKK